MESKKVIHIILKDQELNGKTEFYFGSVAAVYETLNHYILGIKKNTLMQYLWKQGGKFENSRCKVSTGEILRKSQKSAKK